MPTQEFSLQPALSHKERQEEICQMELAEIEMTRAREIQVLDLLGELERSGYRKLNQQHGFGKLDVGSIGVGFHELQSLQQRIERQLAVLESLAQEAERKRQQLLSISKDKKALEKLKEKHEKAIAQALVRAENKVIEDIVTSQFHRRKLAGEADLDHGHGAK